mgnify:CR=1 FL=1
MHQYWATVLRGPLREGLVLGYSHYLPDAEVVVGFESRVDNVLEISVLRSGALTTEGDVWVYPFLVLYSEKVVEDAGRESRRVQ